MCLRRYFVISLSVYLRRRFFFWLVFGSPKKYGRRIISSSWSEITHMHTRLTHLQIFDSENTHPVYNATKLVTEQLNYSHVLTGVVIADQNALPNESVEQLLLPLRECGGSSFST